MKKFYISITLLCLSFLSQAQFTVLSTSPSVNNSGDMFAIIDAGVSYLPSGIQYGDTVTFISARDINGVELAVIVEPDYVWDVSNHTFSVDYIPPGTVNLVFIYTDVNVVDFMVQTVPLISSPLAVQSLHIDAKATTTGNAISCQVSNIANYKNVNLQYSDDAKNFTNITMIQNTNFDFMHSIAATNYYYRIQAQLPNGSFQYSSIKHISASQTTFSLVQNPIAQGQDICFYNTAHVDGNYTIVSVNGANICSGKLIPNQNMSIIHPQNMNVGNYFVVIQTNGLQSAIPFSVR
jgi:hypothetical protein